MHRTLTALPLAAVLLTTACATGPAPDATLVSVQPGEIVAAEQVTSADTQGANAAVRVGAAVLGALVPSPWGGVAGAAGGEAGRAVLRNTGGQWRYFVRMPDGTVQTIEQSDGPVVTKGDAVDVLTLSDGSAKVVAARPAPVPADGPAENATAKMS